MVQTISSSDIITENSSMPAASMLDLGPNAFAPTTTKTSATIPTPLAFDVASYTRILQYMAKLYPYDPAAVAASLANLSQASSLSVLGANPSTSNVTIATIPARSLLPLISPDQLSDNEEEQFEMNFVPKALDLSTPRTTTPLTSPGLSYPRITIDQIKPKITEDVWVENDLQLMWTDSKIAAFNPAQKAFMCLDCEHTGFLSRVAEHWLGSHANLRVFHCPRCPYTSAWSRCVKMHLTRQHNEQFADTTMWKGNATLLEVTRLMQDLRTKVESRIDSSTLLADKRFYCPHCPYATDRRDLYTRHENIHKDDKPFHCYLCLKQFNRADHVKKHFVRMHADVEYDMSKIRKQQHGSKREPQDLKESLQKPFASLILPDIKTELLTINTEDAHMAALTSGALSNAIFPAAMCASPIEHIPVQVILKEERITSHEPNGSRSRRRGDKAFTCHYCNWSGSDNWCLKRHMNTHIKPFACVMCDYKAARAERLSTHVLKVHNKRICNKCNFLSDTQEQLQEHTREEHHNNPYSRRHICATCGMSFDTRANLETHTHLTHTRPQSPLDMVQITPILLPEIRTCLPQDLSVSHSQMDADTQSYLCPVQECNTYHDSSGDLSEHVRQVHGGSFTSRCPHCQYPLTKDEISKDHWLTHHEDVCGACVHVFTSVYGPQLWKKVHSRPPSSESPLDSIVSGLNRKRPLENEPFDQEEENSMHRDNDSLCSMSPSSLSETPDPEADRCFKRSRKQSYPKKVVPLVEPQEKPEPSRPEDASKTDPPGQRSPAAKKRKMKICFKCPHKPKFFSAAQLKLHRFRRHKKPLHRPSKQK